MNLLDNFQRYIRRNELAAPEDFILLTVSGGVDSMVMLSLFVRSGYRVGVAHCNFQLRGVESEEDEELVRREAEKYGVPWYNKRFDTKGEMERTGESMEMAARRLRYAWFDELSREHGYTVVAIAHHIDDSIETFFINLLRGTGLRGLTGITTHAGKLIRPLMFASRKDILEYAVAQHIPYREDSSNRSTKYLRNKIRLGLVPRIKEISPKFPDLMRQNIGRLTDAQGRVGSFENTVIVVSHDRYFLNKVCTNIADMDYGKIQLYAGNYDFWYESSQLIVRQMKEANKKKEEKIKELQEFIQRFSANASKSKQATSRKRALEKIQLDEIRPSSRKYPYIDFRPEREIGNDVLFVEGISKTIDGVKVLDNISFTVNHDDKIAFVGGNELAKTTMFKILAGELEPDEGSYKWGVTTSQSYFPKDNTTIFDTDELIVDWLTQYSEIKDATYVRGFLGRMLFAGEDGVKKMRVLSGGEKVRVLLSRMMIMGSNVLMFDEPTDHLDMESITALNNGMIKFPGVIKIACRDHHVVLTTAYRIIEFLPFGSMIDKITTYDEYLDSDEMARKRQVYSMSEDDEKDN